MVYNKPGPPSGSDDEPGPCATRSGRVHHHFLREGRVCYIPYGPMVKSYIKLVVFDATMCNVRVATRAHEKFDVFTQNEKSERKAYFKPQ